MKTWGLTVALWLVLSWHFACAQRLVVVCIRAEEVPNLVRKTANLSGAQALVMSRVALPQSLRASGLTPAQWERSAYLTLNAGARAFAPTELPQDGLQAARLLHEYNRRWGYRVAVGLLPSTLAQNGVSVRYVTSDNRSPVFLLGAPFVDADQQVLTKPPLLWQEAERILQQRRRLVLCIDARSEPLDLVGRGVARLARSLRQPGDALYLLSPVPSDSEAAKGFRSGWVMRVGSERGLLWSPSTRLPGYITLPDLTATWLAHFGVQRRPEVFGEAVVVWRHAQPSAAIERMYWSHLRQAWWGRRVGALPSVQLVSLLAAWIVWRWQRRVVRALWISPVLVPLLGVSVVPLLVWLPLGGVSLFWRGVLWAVCMLGLVVLLSRMSLRQSARLIAVGLMVFTGVDLLAGGNLLRWSGFGYILQEGARFYGIGNETAGALLGAQYGFLREPVGGALLRWLVVAAVAGAPFWGANTGAMLSAIAAGGATVLSSARWRIWGGVALVAVVAAILVYEALNPQPTHLGRFLQSPAMWWSTVWRKVQMNLTLLWGSAWTPLWLFGLIGLRGAPLSVWFGAIAMFLFNDSGVVASAAVLVWWWVWRVARWESERTAEISEGGRINCPQTVL